MCNQVFIVILNEIYSGRVTETKFNCVHVRVSSTHTVIVSPSEIHFSEERAKKMIN